MQACLFVNAMFEFAAHQQAKGTSSSTFGDHLDDTSILM